LLNCVNSKANGDIALYTSEFCDFCYYVFHKVV